MNKSVIKEIGLISCLGSGKQHHLEGLLRGENKFFTKTDAYSPKRLQTLGQINSPLPKIPERLSSFACKNNQMILNALQQIQPEIDKAVQRYGKSRVTVLAASSTAGIQEADFFLQGKMEHNIPLIKIQEMGSVSEFVFQYLELTSFHYTVSTACSSGTKIITSADRLLQLGCCDAVIVVGADSLSRLTVQGFDSLEAISLKPCLPFSATRDGINLGEAAVAFLMTREYSAKDIFLAGYGETSDAHHMSAPDPTGKGAKAAMLEALVMANLSPDDIQYINLHGTATPLNDAMEGSAVYEIFGNKTPCSSTKSLTGHTLGAAGILEAAFCWLLLSKENIKSHLPPHFGAESQDATIAPILLCKDNMAFRNPNKSYTLSNSFAFGGNNACIVLGKIS